MTTDRDDIKQPCAARKLNGNNVTLLFNHGQQHRSRLNKALRAFKEALTLNEEDVFLGPQKKLSKLLNKIIEKYDGDPQQIADLNRGKIIASFVDEIRLLQNLLNEHHPLGKKFLKYLSDVHNTEIECVENRFNEPVEETGFRNMDIIIRTRTGKGTLHFSEIQVVHKDLEAVAELTHKVYDINNDVKAMLAQKNAKAAPEVKAALGYLDNARKTLYDTLAYNADLLQLENARNDYQHSFYKKDSRHSAPERIILDGLKDALEKIDTAVLEANNKTKAQGLIYKQPDEITLISYHTNMLIGKLESEIGHELDFTPRRVSSAPRLDL